MYITQDIPMIGGLASQMQQYASLYAVSKECNKKIVFKESLINSKVGMQFARVLDVDLEFKPDDFFNDFVKYEQRSNCIIDVDVFKLKQDTNYQLTGRFDLFHYWYPKYNDVIQSWKWNDDFYKTSLNEYNKLKKDGYETISIHIRRGDYLLPQHHHYSELSFDYYSIALSNFYNDNKKYQFLIFSDDIKFAKMMFNVDDDGDRLTFIHPGDPFLVTSVYSDKDLQDLILMSLCDHNIIANSSFSIWAAFMNKNKNKKVVCPKNYLKQYSPFNHINKNYYPPEWISIDNK